MQKKLINAGFSANEAKIYLTLLKLGEASVSQIAKNSGVKRSNTYHLLAALLSEGLVVLRVADKMLYMPESPEKVLQIVKQRLSTAEKNYQKLKDLLPTLKTIYRSSQGLKQKISILPDKVVIHGKEAVKAFKEMLERNASLDR